MVVEYMEQAAALFKSHPTLNLMQCAAELLCFFLYIHSLPARNFSRDQAGRLVSCPPARTVFGFSQKIPPAALRIKKGIILALFFAAVIALHLSNCRIAVYFPVYMFLCIAFVWLVCSISPSKAIFRICPFGLGMEFCRLLCRDAFLTFLLARFSSDISEVVSAWLCSILYFILLIPSTLWMRKETENFEKLNITAAQMIGFVFPLALYVAARQSVFAWLSSLNWSQWLQLEFLQLAILACSEFEIISAGRIAAAQIAQNELLQKQILMEKRQQQYTAQIASIDAINRRYHDLKHYLTAMETMNTREMNASVQAMRQEIEAYECMQKTGSRILDILLSERMHECQQKGIRLIPYIDARQIEFIQVTDLCVIFGNAMDNAIEATEQLEYVNMKEISVKIGISEELLIMRFHNYYEGKLHYDGKALLTSKSDSSAHGYGLESIREAAAKYGGTVAYDTEGNEFSLNILIPIKK
ncbi:MAG: GHKL domain-containing protein [Clostridiales bacterium]|nr:GHKL domain-containing protein [Clostridiales bacterium]